MYPPPQYYGDSNKPSPSAPPPLYSGSAQPAMGVPSTTVQGQGNMRLDEGTMTFFPANLDKPVFLGATVGRGPIWMHCGQCGYQGLSFTKSKKGMSNIMAALALFGIGYFLPVDDTHHFCPQCNQHVGIVKFM